MPKILQLNLPNCSLKGSSAQYQTFAASAFVKMSPEAPGDLLIHMFILELLRGQQVHSLPIRVKSDVSMYTNKQNKTKTLEDQVDSPIGLKHDDVDTLFLPKMPTDRK